MKKIVILLSIMITGCVTQSENIPMPIPKPTNYCTKGETQNCRPWTAGEIVGASGRGHTEQQEEPK